jgi:hypothetical protein
MCTGVPLEQRRRDDARYRGQVNATVSATVTPPDAEELAGSPGEGPTMIATVCGGRTRLQPIPAGPLDRAGNPVPPSEDRDELPAAADGDMLAHT